jgi:hypothetical protein
VDISGDTIVVGADGEDAGIDGPSTNYVQDAGAAYVFVRNGNAWTQQAYLNVSVAEVK